MTRFLTLAFVAGAVLATETALAQTGPILDLSWNTIDGGGGASSGSGFTLLGTIGQHDAGVMTGGGYEIVGGFLAGAEEICDPDCNNDGLLTLADFGCFQTKYALGDPSADCNSSGTLTLADFGCFQTKYALGCP